MLQLISLSLATNITRIAVKDVQNVLRVSEGRQSHNLKKT